MSQTSDFVQLQSVAIQEYEKDMVHSWSSDSREIFRKCQSSRADFSNSIEGMLHDIKQRIGKYSSEASFFHELSSDQKLSIDSLTSEISKMAVVVEGEKVKSFEEKENIHKIQGANTVTKKYIQSKETVVDTKLEKLKKGIKFFEDYLGLVVENVSDSHLKFNFSCIDEKDVERKFSFALKVEGDPGVYKVLECCPPVKDLDKLLHDLNTSNNLTAFLCEMRKAFKKLKS